MVIMHKVRAAERGSNRFTAKITTLLSKRNAKYQKKERKLINHTGCIRKTPNSSSHKSDSIFQRNHCDNSLGVG